jgi:tetratricopeptide (TPR) repeat protein
MGSARASDRERTELDLAGSEVVIVGRLAALSRTEAEERLVRVGGRLAERPSERTSWVVVADGELPVGADGALAFELEDARARIERGQALELLGEGEFLQRLGLDASSVGLRRLYTSAQLARILDVPPRRLAAWVRAGLIRPARSVRRLSYFEFGEVAEARALARLTAQGVTPRRIRASLEALSRWWPRARAPLARLDALEESGALVVRTTSGALAEPSGQLRLAFPDAPGPAEGASVAAGELWFQRALRFEQAEELDEAARAYAKALDPAHPRPEIAFNLGNVLYALGRHEDASASFALATELDPEYVEAWNNLGNALSQLGRAEEAGRAFERALALEPNYADAHFNLAETLAARGELERARHHWRTYLAHDPDSSWAAEVRARLRRTDPAHARGVAPVAGTP